MQCQYALSTGNTKGEYAGEFEKKGIIVTHRKIEHGNNIYIFLINIFKFYLWFYNYVKFNNINVIHIHRTDLYIPCIIAWRLNIRCIKTQHNVFRNRWYTRFYGVAQRYIVRNIFNTIFQTISESVYDNELNYYKNKSVRINNWFDNKLFYPSSSVTEKKLLKIKLNLRDDTFNIISVGSCTDIKNHSDVIRALAIINKKYNINYIHLGDGVNENKEKLLAKELGVLDNIIFLGNKKNVRDYLICSDVFVMTSRYEGLGNSAIEAMACGLPSILYNVPGLNELIVNNSNGFLIAPNHFELARKIEFLINNRDHSSMSRSAINMVILNYSMEINAVKVRSIYLNCYLTQ